MPVLVYSALRLAVLAVVLAALWGVGMRGWLLVVVAVVAAWAASYLALKRQRDAAALWLAARAERRRDRPRFPAGVEEDAATEDAEAERLRPPDRGHPT